MPGDIEPVRWWRIADLPPKKPGRRVRRSAGALAGCRGLGRLDISSLNESPPRMAAKPASTAVKVRPLKKLKDMAG